MPTTSKRYGWKPSPPDHRDLKYNPAGRLRGLLPSKVDLRDGIGPVYDQGELGSCTGNALAGLGEFLLKKCGHSIFTPSRLFIYWNERAIEFTVNTDSGANIRDGMRVVTKLGCPHELLWPYDITAFRVRPPQAAFDDGLKHIIGRYLAVNNTDLVAMKTCLASGNPIVGGFTVFTSFEGAQVSQTGIVPMPTAEDSIVGGHAILVMGYDDTLNFGGGVIGGYLVRNSWGIHWGQAGYFQVPYLYFGNSNLASDFWTADAITG